MRYTFFSGFSNGLQLFGGIVIRLSKRYISYWWLSATIFVGVLIGYGFLYVLQEVELVRQELKKEVYLEKRNNKELVRELLLTEIGKETDLIVGLRDYVYNSTVLGSGDFDYHDPVGHFIKFRRSEVKMLCGGMSETYRWLVSMFDIPARTVQLGTKAFVDGNSRNETHVMVEVYDKKIGKWYVSDPTFNISLTCQGTNELADVEELRACVITEQGISYVANGMRYIKGRMVEEYYLPYAELLHGVHAGKTTAVVDGKTVIKNRTEFPHEDWQQNTLEKYGKKNL